MSASATQKVIIKSIFCNNIPVNVLYDIVVHIKGKYDQTITWQWVAYWYLLSMELKQTVCLNIRKWIASRHSFYSYYMGQPALAGTTVQMHCWHYNVSAGWLQQQISQISAYTSRIIIVQHGQPWDRPLLLLEQMPLTSTATVSR